MKRAVIIMNLGTPAAPTAKAVRAFLKEFLSDPRVVEVPRPIWWCILNFVILPFRSPKVAKAYHSIWQNGGSPLRIITESQQQKLQLLLTDKLAADVTVRHAMTYSGPSLETVVGELEAQGFEEFVLLPLYPQYSATTTGSIFDQLAELNARRRNIPQIHLIKHYHQHPLYIEALANSVRSHWQQHGQGQRLVMSFHGIPQRNVDLGDPYYEHCLSTARLLAQALNLQESQWIMSFQSRLGRAQWLQPYTSETLQKLARESVSHVDVICPAFSADCLETLEEMEEENKQVFIDAGGKQYGLIPCLNDSDEHIKMMAELLLDYLPSTKP